MQINKSILACLLLMLALASCDSEKAEPDYEHLGYQYFPLGIGEYRIYDVQEIEFSLLEGGDTSNYQLKEVVEDYYQQNEEDTSYYLYRYSRANEDESWKLDSVWTIRKDARRIVEIENNVPYIKIVFPLEEGLTWDANGMNGENEAFYTVKSIGESFQKNAEQFEETLQVVEENNMDTVINERYSEAVYAAEIGLVYREQRHIDYCATSVECLGQGIIEGGRKYVQILKEHGKE